MKKALVTAVALACAMLVSAVKADTSWIAYSNACGTVTLNTTSGVAIAPIPKNWVCIKKVIRVNTGTAIAISGNSGHAATNAASQILIQATDGLVTLSAAPLIDAAVEYGTSTGGTAKVDFFMKLTQ